MFDSKVRNACAAGFVAGGIVCSAGLALSQSTSFPISLISFTANTPAVASQVNANFTSLKNALDYTKSSLEAKVGSYQQVGMITKAATVNGTLYAASRATLWGGATINTGADVSGPLNVTGPTSLDGNTIVTGNLTVTGDVLNKSRYTVSLSWNTAYPSRANGVQALDMTRFRGLCSDGDGCLVRMVMTNYSGQRQDASIGPLHFEYDPTNGAMRSAETTLGNPPFLTGGNGTQIDGDGNLDHALRAWNCFLTDMNYTLGGDQVGNDDGNSLFLLNYSSDPGYKAGCLLIVDD